MNEYHLKNRKLLAIAKTIFGDCVKSAYVANWEKESLQRRSKNLIEENKNNVGTLSYDSVDIVLQFSNGNLVEFRNSEWASMVLIKKLNTID